MSAVAIRGATVLAGPSLDPISNGTLVISDGRIAALGAAPETPVPPEAVIVDASGLTLMPGFIDAHVHVAFFDPSLIVFGGVTSVRDLAWPPDEIWPLVRRSQEDDFEGPSITAVGQMLTVERGYPTRAAWAPHGTGRVIASPDDARAAVVEQAEAGAISIKVALNPPVGPTLDLPTLRAITDATHELGLRATGHVHGLAELDKALDASVDELAHMLMSPERIPDETIARMVENGMVVVPTLSCFFGSSQNIAIDNLARFLGAGGTVVYGTDLGNEGPVPGIDPREVNAMARAGMSGTDIIASATTIAARVIGLEDAGTLEVGKSADIVAVRGEPATDPSCLTKVEMVFRRGRRIR